MYEKKKKKGWGGEKKEYVHEPRLPKKNVTDSLRNSFKIFVACIYNSIQGPEFVHNNLYLYIHIYTKMLHLLGVNLPDRKLVR